MGDYSIDNGDGHSVGFYSEPAEDFEPIAYVDTIEDAFDAELRARREYEDETQEGEG